MTVTARPRPVAPPSLPSTPYKGLTHYSASDALFFFGREEDTEIIVANLMASRLTLLYGESGVGKSSLLRAGVAKHIEELARENVERGRPPRVVAVVFPEDDADERLSSWRDEPVASLAKAIERAVAELGVEVDPPSADQPLADLLSAWTELLGSDLLLILDQFEEYLLYHEEEGGEGTLARELPAALARRGLRASFLISIREDALARLDRFKTSIPNLLDNYLRVEHLDREAAEDAIRKPLVRWHELGGNAVEPEDALVEEVLKDIPAGKIRLGQAGAGDVAVDSEDVIETPFLQLVMERLWAEDGASGKLTLATYERLGGAEEIVRTHLDDKMRDLRESEQRIAAKVFQDLVTPSGQKVAWTANDLAVREKVPKDELEGVLNRLREGRIVRPVAPPPNRPHESRYEIFHDKLADAILAWSTAFNQQEERAAANKRVFFLRGVAAVLSLLLVAAGVAIFLFWQAKKTASSQALAATAVSQLDADPNKALGTALRAAGKQRTAEAENALRLASNRAQERVIIHVPSTVRAVAWSPDRSRIAVASGSTAYVWNVRKLLAHEQSRPLILHTRKMEEVTAIGFSPGKARYVLTSGLDRARVWNAETGRLEARFGHDPLHAAFDPRNDGIVALAGYSFPAEVQVWKWRSSTGQPREIKAWGRDFFPTSLFFSPSGTYLAMTDVYGGARAWRWRSCGRGRCETAFARKRSGYLSDGAFGGDGRWLAVGSGKQAVIYDTRKPRSGPQTLTGHWSAVTSTSFGPRSSLLVTGSDDGDARIWEWRSGKTLLDLRGHDGSVLAAVFSPGGDYVLTGGSDNTARIWSVSRGRELVDRRKPAAAAMTSGEYSSDGRYIVTSSADRRVRVWTWNGHLVRRLRVPHGAERASFIPGHHDSVLVVTQYNDVQTWSLRRRRETARSGDVDTIDAAVRPGGTQVVMAGYSRTASIVDLRKDRVMTTLLQPQRNHQYDRFYAATFSRDGRYVAVGGEPHDAWIWDLTRCRPRHTCPPVRHFDERDKLTGAVHGLAFSPDGSRLGVASGDDARVWQWKKRHRKPLVLQGNTAVVETITFNRDASEVATGSADGTTLV